MTDQEDTVEIGNVYRVKILQQEIQDKAVELAGVLSSGEMTLSELIVNVAADLVLLEKLVAKLGEPSES